MAWWQTGDKPWNEIAKSAILQWGYGNGVDSMLILTVFNIHNHLYCICMCGCGCGCCGRVWVMVVRSVVVIHFLLSTKHHFTTLWWYHSILSKIFHFYLCGEFRKIISGLNPSKASGPGETPSWLLKRLERVETTFKENVYTKYFV